MFLALIKWKDGSVDTKRLVLDKMPKIDEQEMAEELTQIVEYSICDGAIPGRTFADVSSIHIVNDN
jgi:hypothetical protein